MAHFTKNSDKCNQYLKKSGEIDPRCKHSGNANQVEREDREIDRQFSIVCGMNE